MADPATDPRAESDDPMSPELRAGLRRLAEPPRALPAAVDRSIWRAIEAHRFAPARPRLRLVRSPMVRWAAAAALAMSAGAWLGWTPAGRTERIVAAGGESVAQAPSAVASGAPTRATIVDALLAAQVVARLKATPGQAPTTEMLARLDVDGDGHLSDRDVAILVRRAVAVGEVS